ncbi:MAG: histidine phosphatase family protein [Roseburia sp.]
MWSGTETKIIEVFFIRHGATEGNLSHRYIGRTEEMLCPKGKETLRRKKKKTVDFLFSSPMKRCLETAEILFPDQKPCVIEEWREMDFGEFEGKNYQELDGNPAYQAWIDSNGTLPFPQGESRDAFVKRTLCGMKKMMGQIAQKTEKIACVVHGGTIMAILSEDTGEDYFSFQCKNGEGYRCIYEIKGEQRKLLSYERDEQ